MIHRWITGSRRGAWLWLPPVKKGNSGHSHGISLTLETLKEIRDQADEQIKRLTDK